MELKLFNIAPSIPKELAFLEKLSYNMWWSWHPMATELFVRLDPNLWRELHGNSRKMLNTIPQARLEEVAKDPGYLRQLKAVQTEFEREVRPEDADFSARKIAWKPLAVSAICVLANVILNLILMWPLRQGGIALATVLSSLLNNSLLLLLLWREGLRLPVRGLAGCLFRSCLAAAFAGALGVAVRRFCAEPECGTVRLITVMVLVSAVFGAAFLTAYRLTGGRETGEFFRLLGRRKG